MWAPREVKNTRPKPHHRADDLRVLWPELVPPGSGHCQGQGGGGANFTVALAPYST